ncbi:MAG: ABC transporter permease [Dehalococcoidia bacterium]|nr:MAG: ABC transporter permease [Dehalococcoidia bacterium]
MIRLAVRTMILLAAIVVLNFLIPRLLPGDPLDALAAGEHESGLAPLSAAARENLRQFYGLDRDLVGQFTHYLSSLARGDLGWSFAKRQPVRDLLAARLPWTLGLVGAAALSAALLGTALGLAAAWWGGRVDHALVSLASSIEAIPDFLIGIGFLLVFAVGLRWFPLSGGRTAFEAGAPAAIDTLWHLTLPYLALTLSSFAIFLLLTRHSTAETTRAPFVAVARAKGLRPRTVALRHVLPNALPPIANLLALRLGAVLSGAIVIERVYGVPGLGLLAFEAIRERDYPVLQSVFLLTGAAVVLATAAVDAILRAVRPYDAR